MTRMFLIAGLVFVNLVSFSSADTLVDVFDDSLQSQIMNISAAQIEESIGEEAVVEPDPVPMAAKKTTKPRFMLASFRISGGKTDTTYNNYHHWTPGKYPMGMVGKDAFFTSKPDEYFYYFAADLVDWSEKTTAFDFSRSVADRQADQHLDRLPAKLKRSAKR